jgi:hypothetical protein
MTKGAGAKGKAEGNDLMEGQAGRQAGRQREREREREN